MAAERREVREKVVQVAGSVYVEIEKVHIIKVAFGILRAPKYVQRMLVRFK
jgi:hypothetical protein